MRLWFSSGIYEISTRRWRRVENLRVFSFPTYQKAWGKSVFLCCHCQGNAEGIGISKREFSFHVVSWQPQTMMERRRFKFTRKLSAHMKFQLHIKKLKHFTTLIIMQFKFREFPFWKSQLSGMLKNKRENDLKNFPLPRKTLTRRENEEQEKNISKTFDFFLWN